MHLNSAKRCNCLIGKKNLRSAKYGGRQLHFSLISGLKVAVYEVIGTVISVLKAFAFNPPTDLRKTARPSQTLHIGDMQGTI